MELSYLRIFSGGLYFLLETEAVAEIVEAGVKRGEEIPVFSLEKLTGLKTSGRENAYVLILFDGEQKTGVSVKEADEIRTLEDGSICPLPPEALCEENKYLRGAVRPENLDSCLEYILAPDKLLERKTSVKPDYFIDVGNKKGKG